MLEHGLTARILVYKELGLAFNDFFMDDVEKPIFGLGLQVVVCSLFLFSEMGVHFPKILRAIAVGHPTRTLVPVFLL